MGRPLQDKVALVTGASRGIGRAISAALAEQGAMVAVNFNSSPKMGESLVAEITQNGGTAKAYRADVSFAYQASAMLDAIHKDFGPVSILVNNAGITQDRTFAKMNRKDWDEVIRVNLSGPYTVTDSLLNDMLKLKWGRIINVSSIVGQMGSFGQTNYAAAKAGLIGWTKALAREYARKGITVNAIAPGYIDTDMTAKIPPPVKKSIEDGIPMGRFGKPEEIAHAAVFLASQQASYITGQVIGVNGGMYM